MPKRLLIVAGILLVAGVIGGIKVRQQRLAERLARSSSIDEAHYDRIQIGMRLEEVEAILGGPPGRFTTQQSWRIVWFPREGDRVESWDGDRGTIAVILSEHGEVLDKNFSKAYASWPLWFSEPPPPRTWIDDYRDARDSLAEHIVGWVRGVCP